MIVVAWVLGWSLGVCVCWEGVPGVIVAGRGRCLCIVHGTCNWEMHSIWCAEL